MKGAPVSCCRAWPAWVVGLLLGLLPGCGLERPEPARPSSEPHPQSCLPLYEFTPADESLLDDLQHRVFNYFWTEVFPETGMAIDHTENRIGKVAATGFGLAAICVGVERGWVTREEGYDRTLRILHAFWDDPQDPADGFAEGQFGLYWHFLDGRTGKMMPIDCVAMCDSADFVAGAMVAGEYFKGTEVETLASRIYDRVEWDRFVMPKPDGSPGLLSFGWVPPGVSESYPKVDGLLPMAMEGLVDNSLLIYVLALGSETHPIPQATWEQYVDTYAIDEYAGYSCARAGALFCRQVPQSFIRFSRKRDRKMDYFLDTANAILADRAFNVRENGYSPASWGLTDCFGKESYGHSAPPGPVMNDGTVGSTAFAGALPHVPGVSLEAMKFARERLGDRIWGKYGFTSSYNLKNDYCSPLYVGIELGPIIMMIENCRSGLIWDLFMRHRAARLFLERAGFSGVVDDFELPPEAPAYASWAVAGGIGRVSGDAAHHGRWGLAVDAKKGCAVSLRGRLSSNDLLAFHFNTFLSCWGRDMDITGAVVEVNGKAMRTAPKESLPGVGWRHFYFELPPESRMGSLCGVRLDAEVTGDAPAFDNCTMEASVPGELPGAPGEFEATSGRVPGTVLLRWIVPQGDVQSFVIRASPDGEAGGRDLTVERTVVEAPGRPQEEAIRLPGWGASLLTVAAKDRFGHVGPSAGPATAVPLPGEPAVRIAAVAGDGTVRWPWTDPGWQVRASTPDAAGWRYLEVDFRKRQHWDFFEVPLNPDMVALHRYLIMRFRGDVTVMGKLWSSDESQSDMNAPEVTEDGDWKLLKYDTTTANLKPLDRRRVARLLLFPAPGQRDAAGSFAIDWIEYAAE